MDLPTHRMVDGVRVELSPDEVAEIVAEWEAHKADPQIVFETQVANGYDTGRGWLLPIDDDSRRSLGELRSQILEGLTLGAWTMESDCPVSIRAVDGSLHSMTIGEVRMLIFMAGNYYAKLVSDARAVK